MFKLIGNVDHWDVLYESGNASPALGGFMVASLGGNGVQGGISVRQLVVIDDPERWGNRPRYIVLACDDAALVLLISACLKSDIGDDLRTVAAAASMKDVFAELRRIQKYCAELDRELSAARVAPEAGRTRCVIPLTLSVLAVLIALSALLFPLVKRTESPAPGGGSRQPSPPDPGQPADQWKPAAQLGTGTSTGVAVQRPATPASPATPAGPGQAGNAASPAGGRGSANSTGATGAGTQNPAGTVPPTPAGSQGQKEEKKPVILPTRQ